MRFRAGSTRETTKPFLAANLLRMTRSWSCSNARLAARAAVPSFARATSLPPLFANERGFRYTLTSISSESATAPICVAAGGAGSALAVNFTYFLLTIADPPKHSDVNKRLLSAFQKHRTNSLVVQHHPLS